MRSTAKTRILAENLKLTMSQPLKTAARFLRLVSIVMALAFALTSCNSAKRLTKANVDEVAEGMSKKQVESILGPPTTIDSKDFVVLKKTTYVYDQGKESVTIVFKDDKVQSKVSTLSE
jgi:outer membrane protein assembly factor BamE (lipoprotein component of BamABCDE complex)